MRKTILLSGLEHGVQFATRDDLSLLLNQGYTDAWVVSTTSLHPGDVVQIASMRKRGPYRRGYVINATVSALVPVINPKPGKARYRVEFMDAELVNTGHTNVTFTANPVYYF